MGRGAPNWQEGQRGGLLNMPYQERWRWLGSTAWAPQQVPQTQRGDFSRLYARQRHDRQPRTPTGTDRRVRGF